MSEKWFTLVSPEEIPPGGMKKFRVGDTDIVVCNVGGRHYAAADMCTHDETSLSGGRLEGNAIVCPKHGARFDVRNGAVLSMPAVFPIEVYEVRIQEGRLEVKVNVDE